MQSLYESAACDVHGIEGSARVGDVQRGIGPDFVNQIIRATMNGAGLDALFDRTSGRGAEGVVVTDIVAEARQKLRSL